VNGCFKFIDRAPTHYDVVWIDHIGNVKGDLFASRIRRIMVLKIVTRIVPEINGYPKIWIRKNLGSDSGNPDYPIINPRTS
jgi:hypothetical protein